MTQTTKTEKKRHRRSVSRKIDDQEYCFDKQSVVVEENKAMFDVQYFVQKSTQSSEEQTVIIDHLNDQNSPPFIPNNMSNPQNSISNQLNKKTYPSAKNKPNKQGDYYSLWQQEQNYTCLTKLKHYFNSDQKSDYNKAKLFRQKHKNKILEINAQYQMFNCCGINMQDFVDQGHNRSKIKSRRYAGVIERL